MSDTTRKFMLWMTTLSMLALVLGACVPVAAPTAAPPAPTATEVPAPTKAAPPPAAPKDVTITFFEEPDSLNFMYTQMWFADLAMALINRGLWVYDDNNAIVPELAEEMPSVENGGIAPDNKTITIHLRQGITWHDGEPVTAHDVVFTWKAIMDDRNTPLSRYPYEDYVESVEATDDYTVVIHLKEPFAGWWTMFDYILPEHLLGSLETLDEAEYNRAPVGFGPFKFVEWVSGDHITLERYDGYWRGKPKLDHIYIRIVPSAEAQMAAIEAGDTDVGVFMSYSDAPTIEKLPNVEMVAVNSGYKETWFFNLDPETGHPALQDVLVRRAIAMAVDRQQITEKLLLGLTTPPVTYWDGTAFANPDIKPYPYDPEQAKKLLDEAGWVDSDGDGVRDKDGVKLSLRHTTTAGRQIREDSQLVVQQMLAEVGIETVIQNAAYDIIWNGYADGGPIATGQYDIAQWSDRSAPDPGDEAYYWLCDEIPSDENPSGGNWYGVCIDELDELLKKQATTVDPAARQALFNRIQEIMHDQVILLPMWNDPDLWAVNTRIKDMHLGGWTPFWNAHEWDVAE